MDDYRWRSNSFEGLSSIRNELDENGERAAPNKRQRVSLACSACRTRKSKVSQGNIAEPGFGAGDWV